VDLVVLGQKHVLTNVAQVQPYEVFIIPVNAIFCHLLPLNQLLNPGNSGTSSYTGSRNQSALIAGIFLVLLFYEEMNRIQHKPTLYPWLRDLPRTLVGLAEPNERETPL